MVTSLNLSLLTAQWSLVTACICAVNLLYLIMVTCTRVHVLKKKQTICIPQCSCVLLPRGGWRDNQNFYGHRLLIHILRLYECFWHLINASFKKSAERVVYRRCLEIIKWEEGCNSKGLQWWASLRNIVCYINLVIFVWWPLYMYFKISSD